MVEIAWLHRLNYTCIKIDSIHSSFVNRRSSFLAAHFQNKFGLTVDIIFETVVMGQIPAPEGPHVAQYHNIVSRQFNAFFLDTRQFS
jgi:hypothetical protein